MLFNNPYITVNLLPYLQIELLHDGHGRGGQVSSASLPGQGDSAVHERTQVGRETLQLVLGGVQDLEEHRGM